jgi:hypothetical protein
MRMPAVAVLALAAVTSPSPAGAEASPPPVLAAQSTHFVFYSRGAPVDVEAVERSLHEVERLLGTHVGARAEYYRYRTPQELAAFAGFYAAGVTYPGRRQIHSTRASHLHEMVHLVAAQLGDPGAFFQEGLAVALSDAGAGRRRHARRLQARAAARGLTLSALVAAFETLDPSFASAAAGSFVSFLIRSCSLPRVVAFFRESGRERDPAAAFRAAFGVGLDEAGEAWGRGTWTPVAPAPVGGARPALDNRGARPLESALP